MASDVDALCACKILQVSFEYLRKMGQGREVTIVGPSKRWGEEREGTRGIRQAQWLSFIIVHCWPALGRRCPRNTAMEEFLSSSGSCVLLMRKGIYNL